MLIILILVFVMWKTETVNRGVLIRRRNSGEGKSGTATAMEMVWVTATECTIAWKTYNGSKEMMK